MAKCVLVIDDNREFLHLLRLMLGKAGYEVRAAESALQAQQWLEQREVEPDAIILDIMMPVRTGIEFLENLRWDARYEHVPVVVLTAMTLSEEEREFVETFSVACLDKTRTPDLIDYLRQIVPDG